MYILLVRLSNMPSLLRMLRSLLRQPKDKPILDSLNSIKETIILLLTESILYYNLNNASVGLFRIKEVLTNTGNVSKDGRIFRKRRAIPPAISKLILTFVHGHFCSISKYKKDFFAQIT